MIETKRMNEVKMGYCKDCNSVIADIEEIDRCPNCKKPFCEFNYLTKIWVRHGYILFVPPVQASIIPPKVNP